MQFELSEQELNLVIEHLGNGMYVRVAPLLDSLMQQYKQQMVSHDDVQKGSDAT